MNPSNPAPEGASGNRNYPDVHQRQKGFIVFCETNLRYEKGFKAWIFLGPYLLGALALEVMIYPGQTKTTSAPLAVIGFFAYLVLFPVAWRRILKVIGFFRN